MIGGHGNIRELEFLFPRECGHSTSEKPNRAFGWMWSPAGTCRGSCWPKANGQSAWPLYILGGAGFPDPGDDIIVDRAFP